MNVMGEIDLTTMQQRMTAIANGLDVIELHGYNNILAMAGVMQLVSDVRQEIAGVMKAQHQMALNAQKQELAAEAPVDE